MKILFVAEKYPPIVGGGETHLHQLAEGLAARGHEVTVVTERLAPGVDAAGSYRRGGAQVREISGLRDACARFECGVGLENLHRELQASDADVTHVINYVPALLTSLIRSEVPGKLVVSLFETLIPGTRVFETWSNWPLELALQRGLAANLRPDLHIFGCGFYERWCRDAGFEEPGVTIPFGTDTKLFRAGEARRSEWRDRLGLTDAKVVLLPARVVPRKRFEDALAAMPAVLEAIPNARLALTRPRDRCNETYLDELQGQIRALGLEDAVVWLRDVAWEDMPSIYAAADVVILPSSHETWGIAVTEAMAAQRPVVTTDIPGREVVADGETGILYPPGDVAALAGAIVRVLQDGVPSIVERASEEADRRFSIDAVVDGHADAYAALVREAPCV